MLPRTLIPTVLGLAALAAGAVAPGTAEAAKAKPMTKYTYKVSVKGTQTTTWTYDHADTGACDAPQTGSGSETIKFRSKPAQMHLYKGLKLKTFFRKDGAGEFELPLRGKVTRQGSVVTGPSGEEPCAYGDGDGTPPVPDCGTKAFKDLVVKPTYRYGTEEIVLEQPSVPESPSFEQCPPGGAADFPYLLQEDTAGRVIGQELPVEDLFAHGKNIVIARGTNKRTEGESQWTQKIRWEVTFKRIRKDVLRG